MLHKCSSKVLTSKQYVLTTYSNSEARNHIYIARLSRRVGQDRKCHRKVCLLNCWSLPCIIVKRYPSTYCLMQGSCAICSSF